MGKVIGIDLGTTNSCISFVESGEPKVEGIRRPVQEEHIPSVHVCAGGGAARLPRRRDHGENMVFECIPFVFLAVA